MADRRRIRAGLLTLALAGGLLLGACGGGGTEAGGGHSGMDMGEDSESTGFDVGGPGQASEASRTVKVVALDELEFDPASFEVEAGETVTFEVTNTGENDHEFSLGDDDFHEEHEKEMAEHDSMMMNEDNVLSLLPARRGRSPGPSQRVARSSTHATWPDTSREGWSGAAPSTETHRVRNQLRRFSE